MIPARIVRIGKTVYGDHMRFYGPYVRKADDRKFVILYDGSKRSAKLLSRFKVELKLRKILSLKYDVDHKDEDKTNDAITNLEVVLGKSNRRKAVYAVHGKPLKVHCAKCGHTWKASASRRKKTRNFCSQSCSSLFYGANQFGNKLKGYDKTKGKRRKAGMAKLVETQRA